MIEGSLVRAYGDIETAVVALVNHLAPIVPVAHQPHLARKIAGVIASRPSSMGNNMFLRQSIIRGRRAIRDHVIAGLATWITVLFDLDNLRRDRSRALDLKVQIPGEALVRLARALARSRHGCILALPHTGNIELCLAHLKDRGFNVGFVYKIGDNPTPTEQWIFEGRSASRATPIPFGRRITGAEISKILEGNGVVVMPVDVYPSAKYKGIRVRVHDAEFAYPPGPARYAQSGTLVLPGFVSGRDAEGFSINILDPLDYRAWTPVQDAISDFTQRLAVHVAGFIAEQPAAYWLWHPIPNDPFLAIAQRQRPELLNVAAPSLADDETTALAVETMRLPRMMRGSANRRQRNEPTLA